MSARTETAYYIGTLAAELKMLALGARLDTIAHLLEMIRVEAGGQDSAQTPSSTNLYQ